MISITIAGFAALLIAIFISTDQILKRLGSGTSGAVTMKQITGEDWEIVGRVRGVEEDLFEIGWASYWTVGRSYKIHLQDISQDLSPEKELESLELRVIPTGDGFDSLSIGRVHLLSQRHSGVLHLPYPIARHLLEDLRLNPKQGVQIYGKVTTPGMGGVITHLNAGWQIARGYV